MFTKELMISGLRRQDNLLGELISELERKSSFDRDDCSLFHERTGRVVRNLKALRKIKDQYALYWEPMAFLD